MKELSYKLKQRSKQSTMKDLERTAREADKKEVQRAGIVAAAPKIPGMNRAAIRKFMRKHKPTKSEIEAQKKREAYAASRVKKEDSLQEAIDANESTQVVERHMKSVLQ